MAGGGSAAGQGSIAKSPPLADGIQPAGTKVRRNSAAAIINKVKWGTPRRMTRALGGIYRPFQRAINHRR
jgi:hypothetical protein